MLVNLRRDRALFWCPLLTLDPLSIRITRLPSTFAPPKVPVKAPWCRRKVVPMIRKKCPLLARLIGGLRWILTVMMVDAILGVGTKYPGETLKSTRGPAQHRIEMDRVLQTPRFGLVITCLVILPRITMMTCPTGSPRLRSPTTTGAATQHGKPV